MRTTLKIDEDVLKAARQMAGDESVGVGKVVSRLARSGLESGPAVGPRRRPSSVAMPFVLAAIFSGGAGRASMSGLVFIVLQLLLVPVAVVVIVRIAAGLSPF